MPDLMIIDSGFGLIPVRSQLETHPVGRAFPGRGTAAASLASFLAWPESER
jgi:hypothetical protein